MSLTALFDHVRDTLPLLGCDAVVVFGKREIAKQINQGTGRANRVVFAPGDEGGALGSYLPTKTPGKHIAVHAPGGVMRRVPRALWDWSIAGRVYVWAFDGTAADDERAQFDAMVELHDVVVTAIHSFASGNYTLRAPRDPGAAVIERRFGQEVMFVLEMRQPVITGPLPRTAGGVIGQGVTLFGDGDEPVC